jgi:hypothetical protein
MLGQYARPGGFRAALSRTFIDRRWVSAPPGVFPPALSTVSGLCSNKQERRIPWVASTDCRGPVQRPPGGAAHEASSAHCVGPEASYSLTFFSFPGPPPAVTLALEALSLWPGSASRNLSVTAQTNLGELTMVGGHKSSGSRPKLIRRPTRRPAVLRNVGLHAGYNDGSALDQDDAFDLTEQFASHKPGDETSGAGEDAVPNDGDD